MNLKHRFRLSGLHVWLSILLGSWACAPAPASPTVEPAKPAATSAPAKAAEAKPAAKAEAKAPADWEQEWQRVLEAAKREGQVTLAGPTGAERRAGLTEQFQKKYGVTVEYTGFRGSEISPRVAAEREAGQFLWDVFVGGNSTALNGLMPLGALDPLEPSLILPEVKDLKYWRDGALEFVDETRHILMMTKNQGGTIFINTNLVKADEFKSHKDLLDPKWMGKILADDPRTPGPGQGTFAFFFLHPELGLDFVRALARQELTLLRDYSQEVDALGQGRFPILVGASDGIAEERIKLGAPIAIVEPGQLREGTDVRSSPGYVSLFNRQARPNATKLYINWLLSQEGQTGFARGTGLVSRRVDVPTDHTFAWRIPRPGSISTEDIRGLNARAEAHPYLEELFGRS